MRHLIGWVFSLLIATVAVVGHADTIPATQGAAAALVPVYVYQQKIYNTPGAVCAAINASNNNYYGFVLGTNASYPNGWCVATKNIPYSGYGQGLGLVMRCPGPDGSVENGGTCQPTMTCPDGYTGPQTVNGQANMCTRPDCTAGESSSGSFFGGFSTGPRMNQVIGSNGGAYVAPSTICDGSCVISSSYTITVGSCAATGGVNGGSVDKPVPIMCSYTGVKTGASCSQSSATVPATPTIPNHPPKCAAGEGVLTTSSGTVACVPAGTPANTPQVNTQQKTTTYPDGSTQQQTTTTTTDPGTGATNQQTSTTNTGAGGGSTAGQAGPVGTTTSSGNGTSSSGTPNQTPAKDQQGDCVLEPTAPHCREFRAPATEGIYTKKDKTIASSLTEFQTTVKGSAIGSAATSFFAVSTPSGSCPNWTVNVPMLNITLSAADYFCNGTILQALQGAGYVMLALATYIAFTWAFL